MTIVRGTVPAELFGRRGYGALLGRLALPAFVSKAFAPLAFSLVLAGSMERRAAVYVLAALALAALVAYQFAVRWPARRA